MSLLASSVHSFLLHHLSLLFCLHDVGYMVLRAAYAYVPQLVLASGGSRILIRPGLRAG